MFYINLLMKAFVNKSAKRIKSGKMLFEKFNVFIILLKKALDSSSNEKKNNLAHVKICRQIRLTDYPNYNESYTKQ